MEKFEICEKCPITNKDECLIEFGSKECAKILVTDKIVDQDIVIRIQSTNKASEEVKNFLINSLKKRYRDIIVKSLKIDLLDKITELKSMILFNPKDNNQIECVKPSGIINYNSKLDISDNMEI